MTHAVILSALLVAVAYTQWSLVGRFTGAPAPWVGVIIMLGTLAGLAIPSLGTFAATKPSLSVFAILFVAGLANGIGVHVHTMKMADNAVPAVAFLTTIFILMIVLAPFINWTLNKEALTGS